MRAGKLKMKRYPVRKPGGGWTLLLLGIMLGLGAAACGKQAWQAALPRLQGAAQPSATA